MKLGIIGWRGMVGQVLMQRLIECGDLNHFETFFFSTSAKGIDSPYSALKNTHPTLCDAFDVELLKQMDILISCQGGDYTNLIFPKLKQAHYKGHWLDASSALRMDSESIIVLDPVNLALIKQSLHEGKKQFIGGNCTVSLLLMALNGLFREKQIEWISTQTYQAASGAGARNMAELLKQMGYIYNGLDAFNDLSNNILSVDKKVSELLGSSDFPKENFGYPLACNVLPWIDSEMPNGQSKEEWKAQVEANKILGNQKIIPIDGNCVRVGAMRSHSQSITIKLNAEIPLGEVESIIKEANSWIKLVANDKKSTLSELTPQKVSGTLDIGIGRLRKMSMGESYLNAFTTGDQLLWGAAEPLRRMLGIILENK